ncbi:sulfurtransferase TusA family protein [Candidatus Oleimmundimicrobium sp.]|uniref:sulfurtransferase TusA family protein n=1 Tax=Candidatus Oleimmundimicrobium sp. TaxID=3060597 RepID=UPI002725B5E8|nr:sulfurtransferase TusA family protein [Candidatus Oleimmundimicrobium sp.]MDO8886459.1 sulfurtransferase TusA family protein [Candidatus Oleimmundimicrobium sp.]
MAVEVDARGLSCPLPVVKTKKAIDESPDGEIIVLIDSQVSKQNVTRLAENKGYSVKVESVGDEFRLKLKKGE